MSQNGIYTQTCKLPLTPVDLKIVKLGYFKALLG